MFLVSMFYPRYRRRHAYTKKLCVYLNLTLAGQPACILSENPILWCLSFCPSSYLLLLSRLFLHTSAIMYLLGSVAGCPQASSLQSHLHYNHLLWPGDVAGHE